MPSREGMENLLPHRHPVRRLDERPAPEEGLRGRAAQYCVDDGEEVDLVFRARLPGTLTRSTLSVLAVIFVIDFFELSENDGRSDDALEALVVLDGVEVSKRRYAFQRILDSVVWRQIRQKLSLVQDTVWRLEPWQASEVAGCEGKYGVQQRRVLSSPDGDNQLKVSFFIAKIKLALLVQVE